MFLNHKFHDSLTQKQPLEKKNKRPKKIKPQPMVQTSVASTGVVVSSMSLP